MYICLLFEKTRSLGLLLFIETVSKMEEIKTNRREGEGSLEKVIFGK